ncbi:class I SAM-dependent methyltransferase [Psychroserpens sp. XS_ASV72]|uniref:class I SAM-dependent methyltransferase n=1 Tax=Psychroserpens sp. XS_ASV72 TaxID=3241293 RepID=UPI0035192546
MKNNKAYLTVKDYSVSGELFQLLYNEELDLLETSPRPSSEDLGKYYNTEDYISHTDSKRNLFEKVYHLVRATTLKRKRKLINSFKTEEKKLLDVGCGTGDFLSLCKQNEWQVVGIEPNVDARNIANQKVNSNIYDIDRLEAFEQNSFDVITLWHVLEHLPNLEAHLLIFKRLLKPNGKLVIAVPNYKSFDAAYYKEFWAAYDVPRHLWHFSKKSINKLVSKEGLVVEKILPMKYDAFYVSLLSEKYKKGFMNPLKAFWIGLRSNLKARGSGEYSSLIYIIKKDQN